MQAKGDKLLEAAKAGLSGTKLSRDGPGPFVWNGGLNCHVTDIGWANLVDDVNRFYWQKRDTVNELMQVKPEYRVEPRDAPWYAYQHHSEFFDLLMSISSEEAQTFWTELHGDCRTFDLRKE